MWAGTWLLERCVMRHRTLASICALVIVVGFFALTPSRVSAQRFEPDRPSSDRTSLIVDPPDGRIPPVTPEVRARNAANRAFVLGTLQATDQCKNKEDFKKKFGRTSCEGGTYSETAPRRDAPSPDYH